MYRIQKWRKSISNYFYSTCVILEEEEGLLREKWLFVLFHIQENINGDLGTDSKSVATFV